MAIFGPGKEFYEGPEFGFSLRDNKGDDMEEMLERTINAGRIIRVTFEHFYVDPTTGKEVSETVKRPIIAENIDEFWKEYFAACREIVERDGDSASGSIQVQSVA